MVFTDRATRSRFDTSTGALHLTLDLEREDLPLQQVLVQLGRDWREAKISDERFMGEVLHYLWQEHAPVLRHEMRHVHQTIAYPCLFLRAIREMQGLVETVRAFTSQHKDIVLRRGPDNVPDIPGYGPVGADAAVDAIRRSYYAPENEYSLHLEGERITLTGYDKTDPIAIAITESDLLEGEAMVFEYLLGHPDKTGPGFDTWITSQPAPCIATDYLREVGFAAEAAVWSLPALVYYAYQTTIPMGAFVDLARALRAHDLHAITAPDDSYLLAITLVCSETLSNLFPPADDTFPILGLSQNDEPVLLTPLLTKITAQSGSPLAQLLSAAAADPFWPSPADFCWPDRGIAEHLQANYLPPYSVVRLLHSSFGAGSVGFSLRTLSTESDALRELVLTLDLVKPIFRLLFLAAVEGLPTHNCPHGHCRYRSRLCWDHSFIPWKVDDCGFPRRFRDIMLYDIDVAADRLLRQ